MRSLLSFAAVMAGLVPGVHGAEAQTAAPASVTGSLVTLINSGQYDFNRLERLSAVANQSTYNDLVKICGNLTAPNTTNCGLDTFRVFETVQSLVQSANELLGNGPTQYSLRVDDEALGFALRWTAAEELSAPGSASTEFANIQLASVMSRVTALRYGATGFSGALLYDNVRGGSAGADEPVGRWGGFLSGSFGYGTRHPTELEDAFAFDTTDFSLGVDYRFTPRLVAGVMIANDKQRINFDASQSVVDGGIRSRGYGITFYGLYQWDGPYMDASLGWQKQDIDSTRIITYPSFNINVDSVNANALGSTNSTTLNGSFDFGWDIDMRAFGIDPDIRLEYRDISISGFSEASTYLSGPLVGQHAGYGFNFGSQSLKSLDGSLGLKIRYAFKPSFGVIMPYAKAELHHNFESSPFVVNAIYVGETGSSDFALPSDARAQSFRVYAAGATIVLPHGWQAYGQYQMTSGISYLQQHVINAGIRGEF